MTHLTPEGLAALKQKLEGLKAERAKLRAGRAEAYEIGGDGWHDNVSFETLEEQEKRISAEIARFETEFRTATVAEVTGGSAVDLNSNVVLQFPDGTEKHYKIGDPHTSDPAAGIISAESPLGKAILGSAAGENRIFVVNGNTLHVLIKSVS